VDISVDISDTRCDIPDTLTVMSCLSIALVMLPLATSAQLVYGQAGAPSPTANVQDAVSNLVKMHEAWGPNASSPNTRLTVKESARSGQVIKFRLYAEGLPKDGIFTMVSWPVTQKGPSKSLAGVTLDESSLAICAGKPGTCGTADKPNDPIDLTVLPVPGEPLRVGLISEDGATKVFAKVVPIPIRGEDRGCGVEGVLLTPGAELVLIEGSGFPANAELLMDSDSEGERHSEKKKADADGHYASAMLPYKKGLTRGTLRVTLKSEGCSPSIKVPWGRR
jgi:hypothetical protein